MEGQLFCSENIACFNETDIGIYKYILANPEKAVFMTIRELAAANHISTSSVLRFCKKLGCDGYTEFRRKLRQTYLPSERVLPDPCVQELLHYFERSCTNEFEETVARAAGMISAADAVIFIGMGLSGILARYGARYFANLGKFSWSVEEPFHPIQKMRGKHSLVVALSLSGETHPLIEQLHLYRKIHCTILSITNTSDSTIARMSDLNIPCRVGAQQGDADMSFSTQVPVMFLIEILGRRSSERAHSNGKNELQPPSPLSNAGETLSS